MNKFLKSAVAAAVAAISVGASANTFDLGDGTTISITEGSGSTFILSFAGLATPGSVWEGAVALDAVAFANLGGVTSITYGVVPNQLTAGGNELTANGCTGGGSGKFCFDNGFLAPIVAGALSLTFGYTGTLSLTELSSYTQDFNGNLGTFFGPSLKVLFVDGDGEKVGSLYSSVVPTAPIPEPETYALMLAGLGAVAFVARRRKATALKAA